MYRIADLVKLDEHITEQSVVQIDSYDESDKNLELLKRFVFSRRAPGSRLSNLQILNRLYEACVTPAKENVFCVIANYGQGKSHFGLVLANFFGRPHDSNEFRMILDKIRHSGEDAARVANFRDFRQDRPPFLVIRLRGDNLLPLDQQFLGAVKRSLNDGGLDGPLPLWYASAAAWLKTLRERNLEDKANGYLRARDWDLPMLISRVEEYDDETYELVRSLHQHLVGTVPQFEGGLAASQLLKWLVDHFCKTENRFGGVLILFDEFSQFIERYYHNRRHAGSLQTLLETVDSLRQRVLFVGFAQHDPLEVVRSTLAARGQTHLEEAVRELQRIPTNNKLLLHTRMEEVLDGYLRQEGTDLPSFLRENPELDDLMWEAGSVAMQAFPERYSHEQGWTQDRFHEVVTKGCFPLHPLTTAILAAGISTASVQTETPRTVLGFVLEAVKGKLAEPAITPSGGPNWIYADSLLDYFWNMLPESEKAPYYDAIRPIEGGASPAHQKILKGILLIEVLGRKDEHFVTKGDNFVAIVAGLTGEPPATVKKELQRLSSELVLLENNGQFTFPTRSGDPGALKDLETKVFSQPFSDADLACLNEFFDVNPEVSIDWGHREDWEAGQRVWRIGDLTAEKLRREAPLFSTSEGKLDLETKRGLVIRLLAVEEEDLKDLEERVKQSLDEAFPQDNAPAVIVVLPSQPTPELPKLLRWRSELRNMLANEKDPNTQQIGRELIRHKLANVEKALEEEKTRFLQDGASAGKQTPRFVVPRAYRAIVRADATLGTLGRALEVLYRAVYRYAPPFFTQYRHGNNALRKEVGQVCQKLVENRVADIVSILKSGPGKDCVDKFLRGEWRVLDAHYRIKEPSHHAVKEAWGLIDGKLESPGNRIRLAELIEALLNPPYGWGFPQLALLLSAWYGYNRRSVQLVFGSTDEVDLAKLWEASKSYRPEAFLQTLAFGPFGFLRINVEEEMGDVDRIIQEVLREGKSFLQTEAEENLRKLKAWLERQDALSERVEQARKVRDVLFKDLQTARDYDKRAEYLLNLAQSRSTIQELVRAHGDLQLPTIGRVLPERPTERELQQRLMDSIKAYVEDECRKAEALARREDVSRFKSHLKALLQQIERTKNQDLEIRIKRAMEVVEERSNAILKQEQLQSLRAETRAMSSSAQLAVLRSYLRRLNEFPDYAKADPDIAGKQRQIQRAADELTEQLGRWRAEIGAAADDPGLACLQEQITMSLPRYEGSDEAQVVEALLAEVKGVREIISKVRAIGERQPPSPDEVRESLAEIETLSSPTSHPAVVRAAAASKERLEAYRRGKVDKELQWLAELTVKVSGASFQELEHILVQLASPGPFFPEDARRKLDDVRQDVERKRDRLFFESVKESLRKSFDPQTLRELRAVIDARLAELEGEPHRPGVATVGRGGV